MLSGSRIAFVKGSGATELAHVSELVTFAELSAFRNNTRLTLFSEQPIRRATSQLENP
jgi:hypothetical protein